MSQIDAPSYLTWDGDSANGVLPRRPSVVDAGGDQKRDDVEFPPDPLEHPTAPGWNQKAKQITAIARVTPACKLAVGFDAGDPFISHAPAPSQNVARSTFSVTDNGDGDTTIEWPAGTFPAHSCPPTGLTFYSTSTSVVAGHLEQVTNGIRVRTFIGGVSADVAFAVEIN